MVHNTYHDKRKMDQRNIYQLAYYGQVDQLGSLVCKIVHSGDGDAGDGCGDEDEGDGNTGDHPCGATASGSGGGAVPRTGAASAGGPDAALSGGGSHPTVMHAGPPVLSHVGYGSSAPQPIIAPVAQGAQLALTPPNHHHHPGGLCGYTPSPPLFRSGSVPSPMDAAKPGAQPAGRQACGKGQLERRRAVTDMLSKPGCVMHANDMRTCTAKEISEVGYLLRLERRRWKLRNIQGLSPEKYVKYALSPLHYACASGSVETITLLLQCGCADTEGAFYGSKPLTCYEMLEDSEHLQKVFLFWKSANSVWSPSVHDVFPAASRTMIRTFFKANSVMGPQKRLCDDLAEMVAQFVPSEISLISRDMARR